MKRLVPTVCAAVLALSIPVTTNAAPYPTDDMFRDDAPNTEDILRTQVQKELGNDTSDTRYLDPNYVIDEDEALLDEEETAYWYAPTYVDREYIVVAVNPKLKRYMVKSVEPTPVKMKQHVIFTQEWLITGEPLKKGERVWLTFDEDESDGIDSERKDGLVYVTPQWALELPVAEE
ncbi:hypothetical protein [Aneurinibacillus sp. REN35]|uniref:hypothetical protein n=1 Tax=Aneurinibacillus sp. REN35 TaxID=3237286 RepID=UPI0035287866